MKRGGEKKKRTNEKRRVKINHIRAKIIHLTKMKKEREKLSREKERSSKKYFITPSPSPLQDKSRFNNLERNREGERGKEKWQNIIVVGEEKKKEEKKVHRRVLTSRQKARRRWFAHSISLSPRQCGAFTIEMSYQVRGEMRSPPRDKADFHSSASEDRLFCRVLARPRRGSRLRFSGNAADLIVRG